MKKSSEEGDVRFNPPLHNFNRFPALDHTIQKHCALHYQDEFTAMKMEVDKYQITIMELLNDISDETVRHTLVEHIAEVFTILKTLVEDNSIAITSALTLDVKLSCLARDLVTEELFFRRAGADRNHPFFLNSLLERKIWLARS